MIGCEYPVFDAFTLMVLRCLSHSYFVTRCHRPIILDRIMY